MDNDAKIGMGYIGSIKSNPQISLGNTEQIIRDQLKKYWPKRLVDFEEGRLEVIIKIVEDGLSQTFYDNIKKESGQTEPDCVLIVGFEVAFLFLKLYIVDPLEITPSPDIPELTDSNFIVRVDDLSDAVIQKIMKGFIKHQQKQGFGIYKEWGYSIKTFMKEPSLSRNTLHQICHHWGTGVIHKLDFRMPGFEQFVKDGFGKTVLDFANWLDQECNTICVVAHQGDYYVFSDD